MKLQPISNCRVCEKSIFTEIISLGNLFLSDFVTKKEKIEKYPLNLILCKCCGLVQLKHTVPASSLYTNRYGYKSGINQTMKNELKEIASLSKQFIKKTKSKTIVLDIGANDGTFLGNFEETWIKIAVEPIKKLADECQKKANLVINDFFNYKAYEKALGKKKAHIISAISCFYDMEKPNKFINDITKILDQDGVFIIQQNYLPNMIKQYAFDNIVHEHLEYYSLHSLEYLLKMHGLEVFNVSLSNLNGGSFRTYIDFIGKREITTAVQMLRQKEITEKLTTKSTYQIFRKKIRENGKKLYEFLEKEKSKGKKIYLYGASTRGNTLLQYYKLDQKLIAFAVERNKEKWGKMIASVNIPIISEKQARAEKPDYLLVLPWFFKNEFIKRENIFLKNGGHFIFPLPAFAVI